MSLGQSLNPSPQQLPSADGCSGMLELIQCRVGPPTPYACNSSMSSEWFYQTLWRSPAGSSLLVYPAGLPCKLLNKGGQLHLT